MTWPPFIRAQFYAIAALGILASSLAVVGMLRVVGLTETSRHERVRDHLKDELARLSGKDRSAAVLADTPVSTLVGLRAGWREDIAALPTEWQPVIAAAMSSGSSLEKELSASSLLVASDGTVWTAIAIRPSAYMGQWRSLSFGIFVVTLLLVGITLWSIIGFRRRAEEARSANERLTAELTRQERLAALGRVAAGVAHEVRNPLASMKLRVDLATAVDGVPAKLKETLSFVSSEITRLDRLVSDLLLVSGRKLGPRMPIDLRKLVDTRVEGMSAWAKDREVVLRVSGDAICEVDPESIARALDNLLRNAVEASPRGGEVAARVSRDAIVIEDHGEGVGSEREGELFEPFFTTKRDGTGLGLAISRAIARAHGGELSYLRAEGCTRLTLRLKGAT